MMRTTAGQDFPPNPEDFDLHKVAEGMNSFVNSTSGLDGVEFPRYVTKT